MSQNIRVEMTPEQALAFAARLTAEAHKVIAARAEKPGAFIYMGSGAAIWRNGAPIEMRIRIGA